MVEMEKESAEAPESPGVSSVDLGQCLTEILKFLLECSTDEVDTGLSKDFCSALLKDSYGDDSSGLYSSSSEGFSGVPPYPLYKHLAVALHQSIVSGFLHQTVTAVPLNRDNSLEIAKEGWNKLILDRGRELVHILGSVNFELHVQEPYFTQIKDGLKTVEGRCAVGNYNQIRSGDLILFNKCLLVEVVDVEHYASFAKMLEVEGIRALPGVASIVEGVAIYRKFYTEEKEKLNGVLGIHVSKSASQPYIVLADIIAGLGYSGIQTLIGVQHTEGTNGESLPPARSTLLSSFTLLHKSNVKGCTLTVGARALAKHANRCRSKYWGDVEGNDADKNAIALEAVQRIISSSCWLNLHVVKPHGVVFEIRVCEGYGARWSEDGLKFIGFLEPYSVDGHLKGWRH